MALSNAVDATVQGFQSLNTTTGVWTGRTLTAGTGISVSNGDGTGGNPTISSTTAITWTTTSANVASMTVQTGYFCVSPGGALTLGLPAVAALGDTIRVSLDGATSWTITQPNAGSQIRFGNQTTTVGVGGSLSSTAQGDSVELVARTTNLWVVESAMGNITIV